MAAGRDVQGVARHKGQPRAAGDRQGQAQARRSVALLGPDTGTQPQGGLGIAGIDRCQVDADAVGDCRSAGQQRRDKGTTQLAGQHDGAIGCPPASPGTVVIGIVIEEQVQPGASAHLD